MLKKFFLSFALVLTALMMTSCDSGEGSVSGYVNISIEDAYEQWKQGGSAEPPIMFVDVRTRMEYEDGHIPGAVNIPIQTLANRLDEVPKDKRLYVYCESGVRSTNASKYLVEVGYTNAINVNASMAGWRDAQYPIEK